MHSLQAAYVRSTARQRLDLIKTLPARRDAAVAVVKRDTTGGAGIVRGADGVAGSGPGRPGFRDASLPDRYTRSAASSPLSGGATSVGYSDAYSSSGSAGRARVCFVQFFLPRQENAEISEIHTTLVTTFVATF